jgi:hypothetical protein
MKKNEEESCRIKKSWEVVESMEVEKVEGVYELVSATLAARCRLSAATIAATATSQGNSDH